jgi:hypothetical protein
VLYELSFRRSLPDSVTKSHTLPPYGTATSYDGRLLYFGEPSKHRIQAIDVDTGAPGLVSCQPPPVSEYPALKLVAPESLNPGCCCVAEPRELCGRVQVL